MNITPETVTAESVKSLRTAVVHASIALFDVLRDIERSNIDPQTAADKVTEIMQPLQIATP